MSLIPKYKWDRCLCYEELALRASLLLLKTKNSVASILLVITKFLFVIFLAVFLLKILHIRGCVIFLI